MAHGVKGRVIAVLLSAGLAAGCAAPTPYQPASNGEGYAERPLEADRYRVTFSGNSLTSRETVEDYLLLRAAEVTLARGYDHFVVVEKDTERSTSYHTMGTGFGGHFGRSYHDPFFYGRFHGPGFGGFASATTWPRDRYAAYANIVMRRGTKPADNAQAYDARAVIERLGPAVARPQAAS